MSIFENPNTTAVDDLFRYVKKSIFGNDNGAEAASVQDQQVPAVVYPTDETTQKLELNEISNMSDVMWFPEEIAFQNSRNSPPNVTQFTIKDYEGAQLDTQRWVREFASSLVPNVGISDVLTNVTANVTTKGTEEGLISSVSAGYDSVTEFLTKAGDSIANNQSVKTFEQTFSGKPLIANKTLATIFLPTPGDLSSRYNFEYSEADLTDMNKLIDFSKAAFLGGNNIGADIARQAGVSMLASVIDSLGKKLTFGMADLQTKDFIQSRTRLIPVQNWEYLFRRVNRRNFSFSFVLYPRSKVEIMNLTKIITAFKYYSHPAKLEESRYLTAPSVFDIKHLMYNGQSFKENLFISRIKPCALKSFNISYTEGGGLATLNSDLLGNKGLPSHAIFSPVGIKLEMQFSELDILTRDDFTALNEVLTGNISDKGWH